MKNGANILLAAGATAAALAPAAARASETIAYAYDARGRLVQVAHSGTVNDGVTTLYALDKADNRTGKTILGAPTIADFSFEAPAMGSGYAYNPAATGASFTGHSGVAGNGSDWELATAPDGTQAAFLQGSGTATPSSITLDVSGLLAGQWYTLSFYTARRTSYAANPLEVRAGGTLLGTYTPASTAFAASTTPAFQATGASTTIEFRTTSNDALIVAGLDKVTLAASP
ncbi:MAG TPA: hypothetical protein VGD66_01260 [Allosphingosinicella sp.]|jgi:hypothetical protein